MSNGQVALVWAVVAALGSVWVNNGLPKFIGLAVFAALMSINYGARRDGQ